MYKNEGRTMKANADWTGWSHILNMLVSYWHHMCFSPWDTERKPQIRTSPLDL